MHPAFPILGSGPVSYPTERPVIAGNTDNKSGGKIIVCGSLRMFDDEFIKNEDNSKILDGLMKYLGDNDMSLNDVKNKEDNDTIEYARVPDTSGLAAKVRS